MTHSGDVECATGDSRACICTVKLRKEEPFGIQSSNKRGRGKEGEEKKRTTGQNSVYDIFAMQLCYRSSHPICGIVENVCISNGHALEGGDGGMVDSDWTGLDSMRCPGFESVQDRCWWVKHQSPVGEALSLVVTNKGLLLPRCAHQTQDRSRPLVKLWRREAPKWCGPGLLSWGQGTSSTDTDTEEEKTPVYLFSAHKSSLSLSPQFAVRKPYSEESPEGLMMLILPNCPCFCVGRWWSNTVNRIISGERRGRTHRDSSSVVHSQKGWLNHDAEGRRGRD